MNYQEVSRSNEILGFCAVNLNFLTSLIYKSRNIGIFRTGFKGQRKKLFKSISKKTPEDTKIQDRWYNNGCPSNGFINANRLVTGSSRLPSKENVKNERKKKLNKWNKDIKFLVLQKGYRDHFGTPMSTFAKWTLFLCKRLFCLV